MGDASRKRLLIAAAAVAALMLGLGAAAEAGLLSRAETTNDDGSSAAAAAIGDPNAPGSDVIAVGETKASSGDDGTSASATALRVGDTKIGEAPQHDESNLLADLLDGQSSESTIDAGCNNEDSSNICVSVLRSGTHTAENPAVGWFSVAELKTPTGEITVLPSTSYEWDCYEFANAGVVVGSGSFRPLTIDESRDEDECE